MSIRSIGSAVYHHELKGGAIVFENPAWVLGCNAGVVLDSPLKTDYQRVNDSTTTPDRNIFVGPVVGGYVIHQPLQFYGVKLTINGLRRVKPTPDWVPSGVFFYRSYSASLAVKNYFVVTPFATLDLTPRVMYDFKAEPVLAPNPPRSEYPTCWFYGVEFGVSLYPGRLSF